MATLWKPKTIKPVMRRSVGGVTRVVRDGYHTDQASWWDTCKKVRARDGGKCFYCGCIESSKVGLHEVHHIKELSKGGTTSLRNLVLVCNKKSGSGCHEKRHKHMR